MIEYQTINGRNAAVAYFNEHLEPADKDDYYMAKIMFEDGEHVWVYAPGIGEQNEPPDPT